jgi:(2S)-methylsuccinyl-CoA dehydrogenase
MQSLILPDLLPLTDKALSEADLLLAEAKRSVARLVEAGGLDANQYAAHGFAWMATYVEASFARSRR